MKATREWFASPKSSSNNDPRYLKPSLPDKTFLRNYQLDPYLLLDFNSVGIERIIPTVEIKNKHLLNLYNSRGKVYKLPIIASPNTKKDFIQQQQFHSHTTPYLKRRNDSVETP